MRSIREVGMRPVEAYVILEAMRIMREEVADALVKFEAWLRVEVEK